MVQATPHMRTDTDEHARGYPQPTSNWGLHAAASASVAVRPDGVADVGPYFSRSASSAACARTFDAAATPVT